MHDVVETGGAHAFRDRFGLVVAVFEQQPATAVQILEACGADDVATVNVLADNDIRQGIKEFSSWPTIPQLYVDGEFVGGADIMREMYQSGELQKLVK